MRMLAGVWLMTSLVIVNLQSAPSTTLSFVFLVLMLLLVLRIPGSRPIIAGVALSVVTLTCSLLQLASHQLHADQISTDLNLTVRVIGVPERQDQRLSFMAKVLACETCQTPLKVTNVKLSWYYDFPEVRAGEKWQLNVRLKPPSSLRNPGGFDAVAWNLVKGVHARGYVRQAEMATRLDNDGHVSLSAIRQQAATRLQRLSSDDRYLGLLQALTVGVKSAISDTQWDLLRDTGTAHLMAISGLHVGLMAGWAMFLGKILADVFVRLVSRLLRRRSVSATAVDTRPFALAASLICATLYAALAGFELPTQRAVLMLSVWLIASLRFRFLPPLAGWCLALVVVLSMTPLNLLSAGFWLSFGTVAILFYLHSGHQQKPKDADTSRWRAALATGQSLGRSHVLLGVVLLPVSAWFFQSGSLIAPLANVIAVPWVAMVSVPMGLLTLLLSAFSDTAAYPFLLIAEGSLHLLVIFLNWLHESMLSAVVLTLPGPLSLILVLVGLVVMLAPRGPGLRLLAVPLFLPAVMYNTGVRGEDGFEVHVLDVGQGLAALVYAGPETLLFDTGGKVSSRLSMFEAVVVPYLHASGRRRIDTVVISHGDEDHAFGVKDVVRHFPDANVYASQPGDLPLVQAATPCVAGTQWSTGNVQFAFLHPAESDGGGKNNRSCVLMIYSGKSRVLLTGDIEAAAEHSLLERLGSIDSFPITMMSAPHHGSSTSSSQAFVDTFRPQYVVFPAGQRNRYGFPQSNVQLRYKQAGSEALITGREGALSFVFDNEGLSRPPDTWWASHRRFWHGIVNPDCWQQIAGESLVRRLLVLSQKGKSLCGK